jgi:hypothetical protein
VDIVSLEVLSPIAVAMSATGCAQYIGA